MSTPFKTPFNAVPSKGEKNSGRIITVPDQSITIRDMFERVAQGHPLPTIKREPIFNPDYKFKDLKGMDMTEVDQIKRDLNDIIVKESKELKNISNEIKSRKTNNGPSEPSTQKNEL